MKNLSYFLFIFALTFGSYQVNASSSEEGDDTALQNTPGDSASTEAPPAPERPPVGATQEQLDEMVKASLDKAMAEQGAAAKAEEEEVVEVPAKPYVHAGTWLAETLFRGKGKSTQFPDKTNTMILAKLGEDDNPPALGIHFKIDSGDYEGDYYAHSFTYGVRLGGGDVAELQEGSLSDQLQLAHVQGIKDSPYEIGEVARRVVTVKSTTKEIPDYDQYKTEASYTLTAKHTTPPVEFKFKMVRNPKDSGDEIIDLKLE